MRTRGFTLLEVLIALGVLGVVIGLSMPALSARLERGSFEASLARAQRTVELGRERARELGTPARVRATRRPGGAWVLECRAEDDQPDLSDLVAASGSADERVGDGWERLTELAPGVDIAQEPPTDAPGSGQPNPSEDLLDGALGADQDAQIQTHAIALFLPNGEAVVAGRTVLVDEASGRSVGDVRWGEIEISPWTGRVTVVRAGAGMPGDPTNQATDRLMNDQAWDGGLLAPGGGTP